MENQESMWYAPSGDTPQASQPVLVPPAKHKKRMPAWGIALILVAVAVLIIGSCLLFRNGAAADPNHPGAAGDLPMSLEYTVTFPSPGQDTGVTPPSDLDTYAVRSDGAS